MALFFDATWFEDRLADRGLSRATLAAVCGLSEAEIDLLFKDQREMRPAEVALFAELLGATPAEVAEHAGVSTRAPRADPIEARFQALEARIAALEAALAGRSADRGSGLRSQISVLVIRPGEGRRSAGPDHSVSR